MNLPRLILADDIEDQRAVPPSVLLVQAMKSRGMCLNIFIYPIIAVQMRL